MAKIQVPHLAAIGTRYGAIEADTGVPTVNLKEGVSLVHEAGRNLTAAEGEYFTYTVAQVHAAAGDLDTSFDPGGALNILGEFPRNGPAGSQRWDRRTEDLWLLGVEANIVAVSGLTFTRAAAMIDPGVAGAALGPGTQAPRNVSLGFWNDAPGNTPTAGGRPLFNDGASILGFPGPVFPYFVDRATTTVLRFKSTVGGAGSMTLAYFIKAWIGPRDTVPPFA